MVAARAATKGGDGSSVVDRDGDIADRDGDNSRRRFRAGPANISPTSSAPAAAPAATAGCRRRPVAAEVPTLILNKLDPAGKSNRCGKGNLVPLTQCSSYK